MTQKKPKVYLAGPDVFLPHAESLASAKKQICTRYGLEGIWPLDSNLDITGMSKSDAGIAIFCANKAIMRACDTIIANLTPWEGVSADVGTAFELGFMDGQDKPLFAYSNDVRPIAGRIASREALVVDALGVLRSQQTGFMVEDFGFKDNLMLEGAVFQSRGVFAQGALLPNDPAYYTDLDAFEVAVKAVSCRFYGFRPTPAAQCGMNP